MAKILKVNGIVSTTAWLDAKIRCKHCQSLWIIDEDDDVCAVPEPPAFVNYYMSCPVCHEEVNVRDSIQGR